MRPVPVHVTIANRRKFRCIRARAQPNDASINVLGGMFRRWKQSIMWAWLSAVRMKSVMLRCLICSVAPQLWAPHAAPTTSSSITQLSKVNGRARDQCSRWLQIIREKGQPTITSPFKTEKVFPPHLVSGREHEEQQLVEKTQEQSFAVIGWLTTWQSSLLGRVRRSLEKRGETDFLYIECLSEEMRCASCRCISRLLQIQLNPGISEQLVRWFASTMQARSNDAPMLI